MTRQQLFAAFFFAVFLFLLFQFYQMFRVFVAPLTWGALLAFIFYPLQVRLSRLLRGRYGLAAGLLTTLVILIVMVPTVFLIILLANESAALYQRIVDTLGSQQLPAWIERLHGSALGRLWTLVADTLDTWNLDVKDLAVKGTNAVSGFLVSQATDIVKNVVVFVGNFFLTTFALFFFFRDGSRMIGAIRDLLPMEAEHKHLIFARLYDTLTAVVQGTLVTAAAQGLLAGVGFAVLDVPFAVFLGCASAFASLLPFGAPLVWGGVAIYLGFTAPLSHTVGLIVWGVLVVGTVDNFIRPLVIGGRTAIPTAVLFFGILGGLQAYGFLGIFLAPVVIAILVAFAQIYREQYGTAAE